MEISLNTKVAEVVKMNFRTADILEKSKIDYCCGGDKSLLNACNAAGIEAEPLLKELENVLHENDSEGSYIRSMNAAELCDYIEKRHHNFVRENIPLIIQGMEKICNAHGANHPEVYEITDLFKTASKNLMDHMYKEENILFPFIRRMLSQKDEATKSIAIHGPISQMMLEHDAEGKRFEMISKLSSGYTPPADACNTYMVTYKRLQEFEKDLHRHIHLENNILFPVASSMVS